MSLLGGAVPFAQALGEPDRERLYGLGVVREFEPQQQLLAQGDRSTHVLVVLRGWSVVSVAVDRGATRLILALRGPGELLGELAALDLRPRSATVHALGPVRVRVIQAEAFRRFLAGSPQATQHVLTQLTGRLRDADVERSALASLTVLQRLAGRLAELSAVAGQPVVRLAQDELAASVGATREAVAKALRLLREQRVVRTGNRQVEILDAELLALLAQGQDGRRRPDRGRM
ncbi:Crp/Fnr family transcriptional regulator [Kitasatospora sp. NPDC058965]|uniref:Crp/Fnr family transcriptional regulator n=1 Tax=Kitasatospora sp. NPDC058965 TaxID=3346682 RepID=UPI003699522F